MSRLDPVPPTDLDPEQAALYCSITQGPRAQGPQHFTLTRPDGALLGPFNAMLLSPGLGASLQGLGAAIRYRTGLSPRTRELAILLVAAHWDSAFERQAHESVGRAVGLTPAELTQLRAGRIPPLDDPHEDACAHLVLAMLTGDIDDEDWARTTRLVSHATIFELTTLVGYYATLALQMRVFRT